MPLPLILGAVAAVTGAVGVGTGIHGAVKMGQAGKTMKDAKTRHKENVSKFEDKSKCTNETMDKLGALELEVLSEFDDFADLIEKIHNKPEFKPYSKDGVTLPQYDGEKLKKVSVGAGVLLGGLGGAAAGTAGGFAAAGATTAAVMALGTASTGTAIASLSGVAATNATLAALGGGAIAAGGGGMALGATMLGVTTLGVGLLVGGVIFNFTGGKLSEKADEAWVQMKNAEMKIEAACSLLDSLDNYAKRYIDTLDSVKKQYEDIYNYLSYIITKQGKTDWLEFTDSEKLATQNAVLLVGLLYKMCQVNLVYKASSEGGLNSVNKADIDSAINDANAIMNEIHAA